jgi:hypothetical protein
LACVKYLEESTITSGSAQKKTADVNAVTKRKKGYDRTGMEILATKKAGIRPAISIRNRKEASVFWKAHCQLVRRLSSNDLNKNWATNVRSTSREIIKKLKLILRED